MKNKTTRIVILFLCGCVVAYTVLTGVIQILGDNLAGWIIGVPLAMFIDIMFYVGMDHYFFDN